MRDIKGKEDKKNIIANKEPLYVRVWILKAMQLYVFAKYSLVDCN